MRSLWIYNLFISSATCFDWILDIILLAELAVWADNDHWTYFTVSLIIQIIARCIAPIFPLKYYDFKDKNKCKRSISIVSSFLLSPILQFYHSVFDDRLSDTLLHHKSAKSKEWLKNVHFSKYQIWINSELKLHSIHAISHGLIQSFPQMILLQVILLREEHMYADNGLIWMKFFISLGTLMVLTPIYCNSLFYHRLNGRDHYNIYTFMFVPLAVCCDLLVMHYILSFLAFYDEIFPSLSSARFRIYVDEPWYEIVAALWESIFLYVLIIMVATIIVVFVSSLVWIVYNVLCTDDLQCNCGLLCYCIVGAVVLVLIVPIWFCLLFFNMIWLVLIVQIMIKRLPLPKLELWEQIIYWIKEYKDINDLKLRLFCVNYHILNANDCRDLIQKEVNGSRLEFKSIRRSCNIKSDSIPIWQFFKFGGVIVDKIVFIMLIILGPIYILSRLLLSFLPILGFIYNHDFYENSVVMISFLYIIWLFATLCVSPMVIWHFYILYHIAPGFYNLKCHGLFYSYLPQKDKIFAIKQSYSNVRNKININWNHLLEPHFGKDIVEVILSFLPGTLFVDYTTMNVAEDRLPLKQQQRDDQETDELNKMDLEFHKVATTQSDSESA